MLSHAIIPAQERRFVIQVHGGAWDIPFPLKTAHMAGVGKAHEVASRVLAAGQPPLQAVIAALRVMEDDPVFDAGRGSSLNEDGEVELDAAVMEGGSLRAGAVAAVRRFAHPCEIALAVMERTNHVLLIREGAERFALAQGFEPVDPATLVDPREVRELPSLGRSREARCETLLRRGRAGEPRPGRHRARKAGHRGHRPGRARTGGRTLQALRGHQHRRHPGQDGRSRG